MAAFPNLCLCWVTDVFCQLRLWRCFCVLEGTNRRNTPLSVFSPCLERSVSLHKKKKMWATDFPFLFLDVLYIRGGLIRAEPCQKILWSPQAEPWIVLTKAPQLHVFSPQLSHIFLMLQSIHCHYAGREEQMRYRKYTLSVSAPNKTTRYLGFHVVYEMTTRHNKNRWICFPSVSQMTCGKTLDRLHRDYEKTFWDINLRQWTPWLHH